MVKALRSCLEAAKGKIKAGHLILRKSPKRTATGSSTASNISRIECLSHTRNNVSKDISYPSHQSWDRSPKDCIRDFISAKNTKSLVVCTQLSEHSIECSLQDN